LSRNKTKKEAIISTAMLLIPIFLRLSLNKDIISKK